VILPTIHKQECSWSSNHRKGYPGAIKSQTYQPSRGSLMLILVRMCSGEPLLQVTTVDLFLLTASHHAQAALLSPTFGMCCRFRDSPQNEPRRADEPVE
jgi:hypothetical protein